MGKNLNFCPSSSYNKNLFNKELESFFRNIKLKSHFGNQNVPTKTIMDKFKPRSKWEPKKVHHSVDTFIEAVTQETNKQFTNSKQHNNLTQEEIKAMNELKSREDIIITRADKGGAVIIMDVEKYIEEAQRQLSNQNAYKKLSIDPTQAYTDTINRTIDGFKDENLLSVKMADLLKTQNPRTSRMYLLPKIHKVENPGRPVISSVECHSSKISEYVDHYLQPAVSRLKSYTKDSTDTIHKLNSINNETCQEDILVTMDVRSLYTNIPNDEGIHAVKDCLNSIIPDTLIKVITTFLYLILTLNNFEFNGTNYLQILGCAMGTKCAPSYASLFMGMFEDKYIYPKISNNTRIFMRFIDDIFFVWKGSERELQSFLKEINNAHPYIKFDYTFSKKEVNFLDLTIYKDSNGKLATKLYTKPTDKHPYLHFQSAHPHHLKKSIPYAQALRLRRICTEDHEYQQSIGILTEKLVGRGYKKKDIIPQINKASVKSRD